MYVITDSSGIRKVINKILIIIFFNFQYRHIFANDKENNKILYIFTVSSKCLGEKLKNDSEKINENRYNFLNYIPNVLIIISIGCE